MKLNQVDYEYLSVLLDEQCTENCCDRLLADEEAIQKWHCYHLVRDSLLVLFSNHAEDGCDGNKNDKRSLSS